MKRVSFAAAIAVAAVTVAACGSDTESSGPAAAATLAAAGGIILASRGASVTTGAGGGDLTLNAIAGAVVGGVSLFGGVGRVWQALLGALVIATTLNGMDLLSVSSGHEVHRHRNDPRDLGEHRRLHPQPPASRRSPLTDRTRTPDLTATRRTWARRPRVGLTLDSFPETRHDTRHHHDRRLRVGVLGAGPIAQFGHLEGCRKARNAELYAICDARRGPARARRRRAPAAHDLHQL